MAEPNPDYTNKGQQPDLPLPPPSENKLELTPVSKEQFYEHVEKFNNQKRILDITFSIVVAIVVVLFIAFLTFILDAYKFHSETVKEYRMTIEKLKNENNDLKIKELNNKIDKLQQDISKLTIQPNIVSKKKATNP